MKKHLEDLFNNGFIPIIILVLTLLLSVYISELQTRNGWIFVALALLFILVLSISTYKIVVYPLSKKIERIGEKNVNHHELTILAEKQLAEI